MRWQIQDLTVEVVPGDIAAQPADAVVNAANSGLWMGGGVAGALKRQGGAIIEREAMAQGPITPGDAVVTGAGSLPCRHVIHAAVMGEDLRTDARLIAAATRSALQAAADRSLATVALPALGTGVGGFPLDRCAEIMIEAVRDLAAARPPIRLVRFVLYDAAASKAFERSAARLLGEPQP